jgi:RNA polymerase sigma-70 factor, ECF subfamily
MRTEVLKEQQGKLASLFEEHYDRIARYIYVRIGDRAEAEDLASDVFVKALESLGKYQERGIPMQAWLYKIAHNLVVDHLRKTTKYKLLPIEEVEIKDDADPVNAAEINIEMVRVKIAMQELTESQREVLQLRFFSGLTSQEVSLILNKSDGAVREMQSAALEKLRQLLGENQQDKVDGKRI